jgi:hypothetical protein
LNKGIASIPVIRIQFFFIFQADPSFPHLEFT